MEENNIKVKDTKSPPASEKVSLRRRIEYLEKTLYELRGKVQPLETEIKKVREYIGMSE